MPEWKKARKFEDDWSYRLEQLMEEMLQDFTEWDDRDMPLVYGFKIKKDCGGVPTVEKLGKVKMDRENPIVPEGREPLVDVIQDNGLVTIIAELPGVQKQDIAIRSPDRHSVILTVSGKKEFYKKISFEQTLQPESAKAKFNNGILEVKISCSNSQSGTEIKVE